MAKQECSHYGWRWLLVAFAGLSWLSLGCSPQSLSMFLMPFADNKTDPEYKLFASDKELTVVVMSNFKSNMRGSEVKDDIREADADLAKAVAQCLRKRCEDNKHKLKLIPQAQIRNFQLTQVASDELDPLEMGRKFKADYVVQLEIEKLQIYEPRSYPKMFRAMTQVNVNIFKVKTKDPDEDHLVHPGVYLAEYPREPISAEGGNLAQFRRLVFDKAGREITRMFIAYPPEEMREHKE